MRESVETVKLSARAGEMPLKNFFTISMGPCLTSIFAAKCAVNKKYNQKAKNKRTTNGGAKRRGQ